MKVTGRDIRIGIWCLILSIVAVTVWERRKSGVEPGRAGAGVIRERFPRFVLGFVAASVIITLIVEAQGGQAGKAYAGPEKALIAPLKTLRTWTFVFTLPRIGLTTRFRELAKCGSKSLRAFTIGVMVNVPLGFFLSDGAFRDFRLTLR